MNSRFAFLNRLIQWLTPICRWAWTQWLRISDWYQAQQEVIKKQSEVSHERITIKRAVLSFMETWGLGSRNIFYTMWHLMWRPGYVMSDYLNGRIGWWDELVLMETGTLLPYILLWQIHVAMHLWSDYIRLDKRLIALIVIFFSVGMGACWKVIEYFYFTLFHPEYITDHPVYADAMTDILLMLVCASAVAIYGRIRHDALVERYRPQPAPAKAHTQ